MTTNHIANQLGHGKVVAWVQSIVDRLFASAEAERPQIDSARAARMFAQALHENSNLEMDWLWCAANMTRDIERRYCLKRALEINPHSSLARSALVRLPQPAAAGEIALPPSMAGSNEIA